MNYRTDSLPGIDWFGVKEMNRFLIGMRQSLRG